MQADDKEPPEDWVAKRQWSHDLVLRDERAAPASNKRMACMLGAAGPCKPREQCCKHGQTFKLQFGMLVGAASPCGHCKQLQAWTALQPTINEAVGNKPTSPSWSASRNRSGCLLNAVRPHEPTRPCNQQTDSVCWGLSGVARHRWAPQAMLRARTALQATGAASPCEPRNQCREPTAMIGIRNLEQVEQDV